MTTLEIKNLDFAKTSTQAGLLPAIIQDAETKAVLMLGYMNVDAVNQTVTHKKVVFWSRTRAKLWEKGETSGNWLEVVSMNTDCDGDTILIQAKPHGPTCHTGAYSCFGDATVDITFLQKLYALIQQRQRERPADSYTTALFEQGLPQMLAKVAEEAAEVRHAAQAETRQRLTEESADLLYHLLVLLVEKKVTLNAIAGELHARNQKPRSNA